MMQNNPHFIPCLLSGGSGSRLWPFSRRLLPKPFAPLLSEPLFESTLDRLSGLGPVHVITHLELAPLTDHSIKVKNLTAKTYYEPLARNTAPAIALVCWDLIQKNCADSVMGVFPADHYIPNHNAFIANIQKAQEIARQGALCLIGIPPHTAETGFGYIETEPDPQSEHLLVKNFHEKPNLETAQEYIKKGYLWNSGMVIGQVKVLWSLLERHQPALVASLKTLQADFSNLKQVYQKLPNISFDYAVLEHLQAPDLKIIPADFEWSDVGTWASIADLTPSQPGHQIDANNLKWISTQNKVYAGIGVDDLIIVDTEDALLITHKDHSQKVAKLYEQLKISHPNVTERHIFEQRPWGDFKIINEASGFKAKVINVRPGYQLSYQSHNHRSEHWVVVQGEALVTIDEQDHRLKRGDYIFIKAQQKHRLKNPGLVDLMVIEVQIGEYLGEDDITRYQDHYGRLN